MKPSEELRETLDLLIGYSDDIKSNITGLYESISELENRIEDKSRNSYEFISSSFDDLSQTLSNAVEKMNRIDEEKYKKGSDRLVEYYSFLIGSKNETLNFAVENSNDIIFSFEEFSNSTSAFIDDFNSLLKMLNSNLCDKQDEFISFFINSVTRYKDILEKYSELYQSSMSDTKNSINVLLSKFKKAYKEYKEQSKEIENEVFLNREALENIVNLEASTQNRDNSLKSIDIERERKEREFGKNFINSFSSKLYKIEHILLKSMLESSSIEIIDSTFPELKDDEALYSLLRNVNQSLDIEEFRKTVTDIFRMMYEKEYSSLKSRYLNLELDYHHYQSAYSRKFDQSEKSIDSSKTYQSVIENEMLSHNALSRFIENEKNLLEKRCDSLFEFSLVIKNIIASLNKLEISYSFYLKSLSLSMRKELDIFLIGINKSLEVFKCEVTYEKMRNEKIVNSMNDSFPFRNIELEYKIDRLKIDKKYIIKKALISESVQLIRKEQEIDLVIPTLSLEYILSQYDALLKGYKTIYDTQTEIIEMENERMRLSDISLFSFKVAELKHRNLIAEEAIDMAMKEFDTKLAILSSLSSENNQFIDSKLENVINRYMADKERLDRIKKERIARVDKEIEYLEKNHIEVTDSYRMDKVRVIMDEYDSSIDELNKILSSNREVSLSINEKELFNANILDYIETSKFVLDQSLNRSLSQMRKAHEEFERAINDSEVESINYDIVLENYKLNYLSAKLRLDEYLSRESDPYLRKIDEINSRYDLSFYERKYVEIDNEHKAKIKEIESIFESRLDDHIRKASNGSYTQEEMYKRIDEIVSSSRERANALLLSYSRKKDEIYSLYQKDLSLNEDEYIKSVKQLSINILKEKSRELSMVDDMARVSSASYRSLDKALKRIDKEEEKQFKALEKEYRRKSKKLTEKLVRKYKTITIDQFNK